MKKYKNVAEYLEDYAGIHLELLEKIQLIIMNEAPDAEAVISYGMPAFKLNKVVAGMYAYKNHVSFFPFEGSLVSKYQDELKDYKCSKGTIQIGVDQQIPETVLRNIIKDKLKLINKGR